MVRPLKYVRLEDYVRLICIFYTSNTDLKVEYVFKVYDSQRKGAIDVAQMYKLLESSIILNHDDDPTIQVKELIDIVILMMDTDHNGKIDLSEFR
ncbi:EF-hand calcium-binding domain-containing protein 1 [Plakobranchus ocellatus]|uniref:EF-hand calcium-binding domain-containing protein 1 n=1 Tax=Plakobranchus ocellatus TaxID=259542 RepID=A0AAV3ZXM3_9GAST|nr:EF-hand calcium-binding domain-containing protein 1 [Plakobranchus ocellatus]